MSRTLPAAWMETSASPEALADGRDREARAMHEEHLAWQQFLPTTDLLCLRRIAAIHQWFFPGPHRDGLERV